MSPNTVVVDRSRRCIVLPIRPSPEPTEESIQRVSLERWKALWLVFERLHAEYARAPGRAVRTLDLVHAGWPDELVGPLAGARRVYTALSSLRKAGLRELIVRSDDGYMLKPDVAFEMVA
jgi:hypothetical protein